jgi:hypothetical protein
MDRTLTTAHSFLFFLFFVSNGFLDVQSLIEVQKLIIWNFASE